MRLLVTRAAAEAHRTSGALQAQGHDVIVSPLTEIVGLDALWPDGVANVLVATSAQAFTFPPDLPTDQKDLMPLAVVGRRTLDAARASGFRGPAICAADVAELVPLLDLPGGSPRRFVYWAGQDRKPDLEAAFAETDATLQVAEAYRACAVPDLTGKAVAALRALAIDAVLHFSRRSARLFLDACRASALDATTLRHLCLSADVAAPLRDMGCQSVQTAKAPNEAALFFLLDR